MKTANSLKQGEQEQVQSAGGYHLVSNQKNVERKKNNYNLKLKKKMNQVMTKGKFSVFA